MNPPRRPTKKSETAPVADLKSAQRRQIPCDGCRLRELEIFRPFTAEELTFVKSLKAGELKLEAGAMLFMEGASSTHLYTIYSGTAFRYKSLPDGRRQILSYCFPGDFIGLQGSLMEDMQHSIEALSDMVLCVFQREGLWRLFESYAGLSFDVTWLAARSERLLDQQLLSVGRRTAMERCAHLLVHLAARVAEIERPRNPNKVRLPITQQHIADTLGMSLVHTNRTMARLMKARLIRWKEHEYEILDPEGLSELAGELAPSASRPLL